jgi:hypothetical protein
MRRERADKMSVEFKLTDFEIEYDNPEDRHVPIIATLGKSAQSPNADRKQYSELLTLRNVDCIHINGRRNFQLLGTVVVS